MNKWYDKLHLVDIECQIQNLFSMKIERILDLLACQEFSVHVQLLYQISGKKILPQDHRINTHGFCIISMYVFNLVSLSLLPVILTKTENLCWNIWMMSTCNTHEMMTSSQSVFLKIHAIACTDKCISVLI